MHLHTHAALSSLYNGSWYFSYIMDYRLLLHVNGSYLKISLTDITRDYEECELTPISLNDAYLAFIMDSSWGRLRLHIYPHVQSGGIMLEIQDSDVYSRCPTDEPEPPHRHVIRITCEDDEYPEWVEGLWSTSYRSINQSIYLNRVTPNELRVALRYIDAEDESTSYDYVAHVFQCGHLGLGLSLRNNHLLHGAMQERRIIFDHERREIRSVVKLLCRPCREQREPLDLPSPWED